VFGEGDQALVEDGDPVRITRQIRQHRFRSSEWALRIHHPFACAHRSAPLGEAPRISELGVFAEKAQPATAIDDLQLFEEASPEQAREYAHWKEETWLARYPPASVRRQSTTGNDAMHMGMMRERRSPMYAGRAWHRSVLRASIDGDVVNAVVYDYPFAVPALKRTDLKLAITKLDGRTSRVRASDTNLLIYLNSAIGRVKQSPAYLDRMRKFFISDQVVTTAVTAGEHAYSVEHGDTLNVIASSQLGSGGRYGDI